MGNDAGRRAARYDLVLVKGEDYNEATEILDDFDNNVDLSQDSFRADLREYDGGPILASFVMTTFSAVVDGVTKWFYNRFMDRDTISALTIESGVWDQFQKFSDDLTEQNFYGDVRIYPNRTEPTDGPIV